MEQQDSRGLCGDVPRAHRREQGFHLRPRPACRRMARGSGGRDWQGALRHPLSPLGRRPCLCLCGLPGGADDGRAHGKRPDAPVVGGICAAQRHGGQLVRLCRLPDEVTFATGDRCKGRSRLQPLDRGKMGRPWRVLRSRCRGDGRHHLVGGFGRNGRAGSCLLRIGLVFGGTGQRRWKSPHRGRMHQPCRVRSGGERIPRFPQARERDSLIRERICAVRQQPAGKAHGHPHRKAHLGGLDGTRQFARGVQPPILAPRCLWGQAEG